MRASSIDRKKARGGKRWLAAVLALVLAAGMTACGGSGETTAADSSGAGSSAEAGGEEAKVMRFGSTGYFAAETLDPANGWDGWYMTFDGALETLFKLDENMEPEDHHPAGGRHLPERCAHDGGGGEGLPGADL